MHRKFLPVLMIFCMQILFSCGGPDNSGTESEISSYFPKKVKDTSLKRSSEIRIFAGDSLYNYINGGAEVYHQYGFTDVHTCSYMDGDLEITADIYRFDKPVNAYGLYTSMRPEETEVLDYGIQGYSYGGMLEFVKDVYLVRLTGFTESSQVIDNINALARTLDNTIPGEKKIPNMFAVFPVDDKIMPGDKYHATQFMGHKKVDGVFTQEYNLDGTAVTLFISRDPFGNKFMQIYEDVEIIDNSEELLRHIPLPANNKFIYESSYYGNILVCHKNKTLIGFTNYSTDFENFFVSWLIKL